MDKSTFPDQVPSIHRSTLRTAVGVREQFSVRRLCVGAAAKASWCVARYKIVVAKNSSTAEGGWSGRAASTSLAVGGDSVHGEDMFPKNFAD